MLGWSVFVWEIFKGNEYTVISFSAKLAEIRSKTVEYAQFKFDHHFWSNLRQSWSKCFQTGRILADAAHKKPAMGRISTKLNEIRPKIIERIFPFVGQIPQLFR
jgi:hypothetical protein